MLPIQDDPLKVPKLFPCIVKCKQALHIVQLSWFLIPCLHFRLTFYSEVIESDT